MPLQNHELERARRLVDAGRYDEAEALLAASAGRDSADACRLRAAIARARGRPAEEARALESLLALLGGAERTAAARAWGRLALLRARLGQAAADVAATWQNAADAAPAAMKYRRGLAQAQFAAQDLDGARSSAEHLLQHFPGDAFSQVFAGHVHKASGRRGAAADCYRRALALDPASGEALYNLVEMAGTELDTATCKQAMDLAERNSLPAAERINAAFAAARIRDREGRHREAFEYLRRANELARADLAGAGIRYESAAIEAAVTRTIAEYPAAGFDAPLAELPIDLVPIFVVGPPRSGTTLIEQILSSHSMIEAGGELLAARRAEFAFRQARA
ncbi:MAG TPA: sulfotransferase, partial [Woeseiaceae bacterium]|nr:sulfotransferase [Woeseiaceae bacterium]